MITAVLHQFQRMLKTAGLPRLRFHDLRHTCAILLIAQGVHPRYVMDILGHSQIALTMNTYGHVFLSIQPKAASKMDEILSRVDVRPAVKEGGRWCGRSEVNESNGGTRRD